MINFFIIARKPLKISDLADDIIRFYGLEPDKDIPIVFTGQRPGEKLLEEILTAEEGTAVTIPKKILIAKDTNNIGIEYTGRGKNLISVAKNSPSKESIIPLLKELVPTYRTELTQGIDSKKEQGYLSDSYNMLKSVAKIST